MHPQRHDPDASGSGRKTLSSRLLDRRAQLLGVVAVLAAIAAYLVVTDRYEPPAQPGSNGVTVQSMSLRQDPSGQLVLTVSGTAGGVPAWEEIWATARPRGTAAPGSRPRRWLVVPGARDGNSWRAQLSVPDPSYLPLRVVAAVTQAAVAVPSCPPHALCDTGDLLARYGPRLAARHSAAVLSPARASG